MTSSAPCSLKLRVSSELRQHILKVGLERLELALVEAESVDVDVLVTRHAR